MQKGNRVIQEIARATIEVAQETGDVAHTIEDLTRFGQSREVNAQMRSTALGAITALLRRNLLSSFQLLLEFVRKSARTYAKHSEVQLTSAIALRAEERAQLQKILEKKLNGTVRIEERVDRSLLAGFVIETDEWRFDASVKGHIFRLQRALSLSSTV